MYVAQQVPGGVVMFDSPKPTVIIEASFVDRPDGERRFLLGRAFEPLRGGYALVTRLRAAQRAEVGHLLDQLIKPEAEREQQVQEFVKALPRKAAKAVERLAGLAPGASIDGWFAALGAGGRSCRACSRATMSVPRRACWRGSAARSSRCRRTERWRSARWQAAPSSCASSYPMRITSYDLH